MTRQRQALARWGEEQAAILLKGRGMVLLHRNYRCPFGEVDLILRDGDILVFAEVKTRSNLLLGSGAEAVDRRKQGKLRRLAQAYVQEHRLHPVAVRFDVISVTLRPVLQVDYIPGAF